MKLVPALWGRKFTIRLDKTMKKFPNIIVTISHIIKLTITFI